MPGFCFGTCRLCILKVFLTSYIQMKIYFCGSISRNLYMTKKIIIKIHVCSLILTLLSLASKAFFEVGLIRGGFNIKNHCGTYRVDTVLLLPPAIQKNQLLFFHLCDIRRLIDDEFNFEGSFRGIAGVSCAFSGLPRST